MKSRKILFGLAEGNLRGCAIRRMGAAVMLTAMVILAGCGGTPQAVTPGPGEALVSTPEVSTADNNIGDQPMRSVVLDWSDRTMGQASSPAWLKLLVINGNSSAIRSEFGIPADSKVDFSVADRSNRDEARVQAGLLYAQKTAQALKQYVVTGAASRLDQGQMDIVEDITTATKVTMTGTERIADFWQLVETEDPSTKAKSRVYKYWVVYIMPQATWSQLTRKYVNDIIGQVPDRAVQVQLANAYADIEREASREQTMTDAEFKQKIDLQYQAAKDAQEREMAKINQRPATTAAIAGTAQAQARAEQDRLDTARWAAYRSGDPAIAAVASTTSADFDWISALATAVEVLK